MNNLAEQKAAKLEATIENAMRAAELGLERYVAEHPVFPGERSINDRDFTKSWGEMSMAERDEYNLLAQEWAMGRTGLNWLYGKVGYEVACRLGFSTWLREHKMGLFR